MTSRPSLESDLDLAQRLADEARSISLALFRGEFERRLKADGSIVTAADEAIERAIRARLDAERPQDAMLGEEFGETGSGSRRWIVDAIDGTASFAAGTTQWGTLVALEIDGTVAVGVCDMAPIDRRYFAASGSGAFLSERGKPPRQLAVSGRRALEGARSFVPGKAWLRDPVSQSGADALKSETALTDPDDHPALLVASGELEVAAFFMGGPWDVAAPSIVVTEAGGRFTDLEGGESIALGGGLFSNGHVHGSALELVRRSPGARPRAK